MLPGDNPSRRLLLAFAASLALLPAPLRAATATERAAAAAMNPE